MALAAWAAGDATAMAAPPLASDLVRATLHAEDATVAPGQTLWTDLHLTITPGWHIYWKNPGDSGLPTEIDWSLPPGFSAGAIVYNDPNRINTSNARIATATPADIQRVAREYLSAAQRTVVFTTPKAQAAPAK